MYDRLPIRAVSLGLLALLIWWLWPSGPDSGSSATALSSNASASDPAGEPLVSAIQPVRLADAAVASGLETAVNDQTLAAVNAEFIARYEQANDLAQSGESDAAAGIYEALIADNAQAIEPYVNLATLYANNNQLVEAQATLTAGLSANQSYATLFSNLKKVLGAMAANAYQEALEQDGDKISAVQLPLLRSLNDNAISQQQLKALQQKLAQAQSQVAESQAALSSSEDNQRKSAELEAALKQAVESKDQLEQQYQTEIAQLQKRLDEQTVANRNLAASNEQQEIALLAAQESVSQANALQEQKDLAAAEQTQQLRLERERLEREQAEQAKREQEARELAMKEQVAREEAEQQLAAIKEQQEQALAVEQAARQAAAEKQAEAQALALQQKQDAAATELAEQQSKESSAISQVNTWAEAWSDQDVERYVASYADDYTPPGSGLGRDQWLEQRRVRLTNKSFIQVAVSDFKVSPTDAGFEVTFTQHYKSNTMDDRIRKRLSFSAPDGDWNAAKIVQERVIR